MPEKNMAINKKALEPVGIKLKSQFQDTETRRFNFRENEWLESLRQYKRIYDPDVESRIPQNKSRVYPGYTRSKVQPTIAKLNNTLFPDNDKNWEFKITPNPKLNSEQLDEVIKSIEISAEGESPREITQQEIDKAVMTTAKVAVENMSRTVDDQLTESKYPLKAKASIRSGVMYGTGILKGPLTKGHMVSSLVEKEGVYTQEEKKEFRPFGTDVSIWKFFPDMSATELEHCNFVYELHAMTKHEVRKLGKKKNFDNTAIREYIKTHKDGDYKLRNWEIDLKTIKDQEDVKTDTGKYEVLEYNGYLDGHVLFEAGIIEEKDAESDQFVNIWLLGNKVIKAIIHPIESLTELYHLFYFEKDDSSIFGDGLPRIIRDTQISICSSVRAMLDNAAWVAGPITETNEDLLADEETDDMYPGRNYVREGRGIEAQYPAIRALNITSHINEYLAIIAAFEHIGDLESSLPSSLYGADAKTTNETAKGVSIASSNTNITVNDIVKNFDTANESFLRALYKWNMEYNEDESIKGDMQVKAIGSSSLVSKEVRTQALDQFMQALSPEDEVYIKRREVLEERFKLHDLEPDKLLNTEDEAEAIRESRRDSEAVELEKLHLEAETRYENAKALNMETKSEATVKGMSNDEVEVLSSALEKIRGGKNEKAGDNKTA
jgi:hypothetical protein